MHFIARAVISSVVLATIAACSTLSVNSTYDAASVAWAQKQGTATLNGQAFLRRNDGVVVYGAGSQVTLTPESTYAAERFAKAFPNGARVSYAGMNFKTTDPAYAANSRTTIADGEGKFTFTNLPEGAYFITAPVVWSVQYVQQGGLLMMEIYVQAGQTQQIILDGQ